MSASPVSRPESRLRLRSLPFIALGYIAGPIAGLTAFCSLLAVDVLIERPPGLSNVHGVGVLGAYVLLLIFGGVPCLLVELVFVTPLLVAFHHYRWAWLNGWALASVGFALGFGAALLTALSGASPTPQYQTDWGLVSVIEGHRTLIGWVLMCASCAVFGIVGMVAAIVFRLIAIRRMPGTEVEA
jgi:hypothetical protein